MKFLAALLNFALILSVGAQTQTAPRSGGVPRGGGPNSAAMNEPQTTLEELAKLPVVTLTNAQASIKDVKAPDEFNVTIFATPPAVNYPTFVSAAPDGTLYVSVDGNGSLGRRQHLGRVLRLRDLDGDGQADEVKAFIPDLDSPRGLVWDHDRLYILHPPNISAFIDKDGDGIADEEKILVKGIGWTFKDRTADHASNGLELGIDGWIYAAIGDFGFMEAIGTDGRKVQLRGGGVIRVRPDGSGLELWAYGTRNIYEVAVGPLLEAVARDNTNDGGGWDVRFHHFSGMTDHGYPRLFKNFSDENIQPLADYGGGSGTGAAWIDEPGIPAKWNNAPFTCDWGRDWIYHHGLTTNGATFAVTQDQFLRLPRVTDLDVDANSAIYAASWKGASFNWVGRNVGYIVRLTPKDFKPEPLPDFQKLSAADLVKALESLSHRRRLEAQRTLLSRRVEAKAAANLLESLAAEKTKPLASRVAAIFTLKQSLGAGSHQILSSLAADETIAPWILRALGDDLDQAKTMPIPVVVAGLKSTDPRVRKEALITLARAEARPQIAAMLPLMADNDSIVAHTAVQAMKHFDAADECLAVLDRPETNRELRTGALHVLQTLHESRVVDGLIARLNREPDVDRRSGIVIALARLYFIEGKWKGDSWGTRPDTRGPYFQFETWSESPKIASALEGALQRADAKETVMIAREFQRHRLNAGRAISKIVAHAAGESALLPFIAAQLVDSDEIPEPAIPVLAKAAIARETTDEVRAQAVIALSKTDRNEAWSALLPALQKLQPPPGLGGRGGRGGRGGPGGRGGTGNPLSIRARNAVLDSPYLAKHSSVITEQAARTDANSAQLSQFADTLLLTLASRKVGAPEVHDAATSALDLGWNQPKRRVQIIKAAATARDYSRASQIAEALNDPDTAVAEAATNAVRQLGIDLDAIRAEAKLPRVGSMPVSDVLDAVTKAQGESRRGQQLFTQLSCTACHTVNPAEPLKGPFLGTIANTYRRREVAEAILLPNKTIAQGFVANHFELKDGIELDGFVVREAADAVTIRTITAQEHKIFVAQIARREKQEKSLMPEGLVATLSVNDFASLLDYLEGLAKTGP